MLGLRGCGGDFDSFDELLAEGIDRIEPVHLAVRLLESSYRTARSEGAEVITARHIERTCELEGLDSAGLDKNEQKYLGLLAQSKAKPVRLNVISSVIGLPSRTIADVTEKFLLREGLIIRCESGRALTEKGLEYVERNLHKKA